MQPNILKISCEHPCGIYLPDIEFARRSDATRVVSETLHLQLVLPQQSRCTEGGLPLVVFVPGGGFRRPKMYWRVPWAARLAERGFVVAMPQYRGTEDTVFPGMVEDVLTAIRFLRKNAAQYCVDPERVVLLGGSAGGHIALMSAYAGNQFHAVDDDLSISARVSGIIDLYGPVDTRKMLPEGCSEEEAARTPEGMLIGGKDLRKHPEAVERTVVTNYVKKGATLPPTLILHGNADNIVPLSQSELLAAALEEAGQDVTFYCLDGAGHADPRFFQPEAIDIYEKFVRRVTGMEKAPTNRCS